MKLKKNTPLVTTDKVDAAKAFYCEHFGFRPVFDNGDHLALVSPDEACEISFMKPCEGAQAFGGEGLIYCFEVEDVDAEYERLSAKGVSFVQDPQDNPWGDRSAIALDPIGISVYIYKMIPPTEEFAKHFVS